LFEAKPKQNHLTAIKQQLRAIQRLQLGKNSWAFCQRCYSSFSFLFEGDYHHCVWISSPPPNSILFPFICRWRKIHTHWCWCTHEHSHV